MTRALLAAAALLVPATCLAGENASRIKQPAAGVFKMREELVGKHPRLYFTKDDLPRIRELARGPNRYFADRVKRNFGGRFRSGPPAKPPGWERYLYGFWGLVGADLLYLTSGDAQYRDIAKKWVRWNLDQSDWKRDDIVPMDILSGLSITYDMLYDEFTEAERSELRRRIYEMAGFIHGRFFVGQYWTGDYQNNHMHNRIHGLANASFAIYGDDPELDVQKYADMAFDQWQQVVRWLPEDGSTHEGPGYWSFGHHWLVRTAHLVEHVTGYRAADHNPHFDEALWYRLYMTCPGWKRTFNIGDAGAGAPGNLTTLVRLVAETKSGPGMTVLKRLIADPKADFYQHPAWGILWHDATVAAEPLEKMPLGRFWPDADMLSVRSSWKDDAAGFVFICGPPGGHKLQRLRGANWANVAHSHPDHNHFLLYAHGALLAEDDQYPKKAKLTRSHNTITIDGKAGPREGTGWYQPFDYKRTAFMQDVLISGSTAYAAGNASRLYDLAERFVRHVAFVDGEYVIVYDDLVAAGAQERSFEWRLHKKGEWKELSGGHFAVTDDADKAVSLDIRFLVPDAAKLTSRFLPAEMTARPCVEVVQKGRAARYVAILVPKKSGKPELKAEMIDGAGRVAVKATGAEHDDIFAVTEAGHSSLTLGDVKAECAALLVRRDKKGEIEKAMLVRGTSLSVAGKYLLAASRAADFGWRRTKGGVLVDAKPSHNAEPAKVRLSVGGLKAGTVYPVGVDGESVGRLKTVAGAGVLSLEVDLSKPRTITIGGAAASFKARAATATGGRAEGRRSPERRRRRRREGRRGETPQGHHRRRRLRKEGDCEPEDRRPLDAGARRLGRRRRPGRGGERYAYEAQVGDAARRRLPVAREEILG